MQPLALFESLQFLTSTQRTLGGASAGTVPQHLELPGGSPFSLCPAASASDLLRINSVELTPQPLHIDDVFDVHIYGEFQKSFGPEATLNLTVDCGSHCEMYGVQPGEPTGESGLFPFCKMSLIEQPLGGKEKNATCSVEEGYALITSGGGIVPMFIRAPAWYNCTFDVTAPDGQRIFCLTAEVCLRWEDEQKNKGYPPGPWTNCTWPR